MKNKQSLFLLLSLLFIANYSLTDDTGYKLFGKNKNQSKRCIIFSTLSYEGSLIKEHYPTATEAVPGGKYIFDRMQEIGIDCGEIIKKSTYYDNNYINIDTVVSMFGKQFKDKAIIFLYGHNSMDDTSINTEDYHPSDYDKFQDRLSELRNKYGNSIESMPGFDNNGKIYTWMITADERFLRKYVKIEQKSLLTLMGCYHAYRPQDENGVESKEKYPGVYHNLKDFYLNEIGVSVVIASKGKLDINVAGKDDLYRIFKPLCGKESFVLPKINNSLEDVLNSENPPKNLNICTIESFNKEGGDKKESGDLKYVLYRAPHVEEITVFSGQKDTESYDEYYHYVYEGKDIHNPVQPYPWKDYKSIDKPPSQKELTTRGSIKPLGVGVQKLNVEVIFSEEMKEELNVKLGFSSSPDENDITIPGKIEDPKSDKSKWIGTLDITDLVKEKLFKGQAINFHIKGEDTIDHDDMKGLNKDGDGRWFADKDKAFDDNHWFMVGSEPVMTVSSMEIDELHLPFQQAPPDGRVNMQPLMLNGDIALPENFSWQEVYCDDKTGVEHDRCIYNINQHNYNDNLEPTGYFQIVMYISIT